MIACEYRCRPQ